MAFLSKVGNILRQTASKQVSAELSASRPSIYQALRCLSSSKLFVGGISYSTDDTSLTEAFSKYGEVIEARIIFDRDTGRSRGFGFVTFTSSEEASSAIQALDGQDLHGRRIRVDYANDRARGSFGGGGGGYGGGGYGGGGYGGGGYGGSGYSGGGSGGYNSNFGGNASGVGYGTGGSEDFGSPSSNYGSGPAGNFTGGSLSDSGKSGDFGGSFGVGGGGGGGGSDNLDGSNMGSGGFGDGDQFGANESSSMGGYDQNEKSEPSLGEDDLSDATYKDEDDTDDFAKRA